MVIGYRKKTMSQLFLIPTGLFNKKEHKILENSPYILKRKPEQDIYFLSLMANY